MNKISVYVLICGLLLSPVIGNADEVITCRVNEGIVSIWRFDENKGDVAYDAVQKNKGFLRGEPIWVSSPFGNALDFSGTNYVEVAHNESLNATTELFIEAWIYPRQVDRFRTIVWKGARDALVDRVNYYLNIRYGFIEFKWKGQEGEWYSYFGARQPVKENQWSHIMVKYKKGDVAIYVNGILDESATWRERGREESAPYLFVNTDRLQIGMAECTAGDPGWGFIGIIDELYLGNVRKDHTPSQLFAISIKATYLRMRSLSIALEIRYNSLNMLKNKIEKEGIDFSRNLRETIDINKVIKNLKDIQAKLNLELSNPDDLTNPGDFINKEKKARLLKQNELISKAKDLLLSFELKEKEIFQLYVEKKNRYLFSRENFGYGVGVRSSMEKIMRHLPFKAEINPEAFLALAKNEFEGFQVVIVTSKEKSLKDVTVSVSDLVNRDTGSIISKENIEIAIVEYVGTLSPPGLYPDILNSSKKVFDVKANDIQPIWVTIYTPPGSDPGLYEGNIIIKPSNAEKTNVELTVHVWDFTLPKENNLKVAFSFFEHFVKLWYGFEEIPEEIRMGMYDFLLRRRIGPMNLYSRKMYPRREHLRYLIEERGLNVFTIGRYIKSKELFTDDFINAFLDNLADDVEFLRANDWMDRVFFYGFDEILLHPRAIPPMRQLYEAMEERFPDLRRLVTAAPDSRLEGLVDAYVPLMPHYNKDCYEKKGLEVWWYIADDPTYPMPNFFLDYPAIDHRIIFWMNWKYQIEGFLYWCINREWKFNARQTPRWPESPWKPVFINVFTGKPVHRDGMGNFIYPGPEGVLFSSIRFENIRDGIEDFEYFYLLNTQLEKLRLRDEENHQALIAETEEILKIDEDVLKGRSQFTNCPHLLLEFRKRVAKQIEKVNEILAIDNDNK